MGFLSKIIQRIVPEKPTRPFLVSELAVTEEAIYKRMKLVPYTPDKLLTRKKIDIFNQMILDPEIESAINTLKTIRLSSGWTITPASDKPEDIYISDFVRYNLENVEGTFEDDLKEIMGAVEMGISICELVWDTFEVGKYKGKIRLKAIKSKNPKYFNIWVDDFDNIRENGVVNISAFEYGRQYPAEKFVIYSFNKRYENVFGVSRLRSLYDLWFLKQILIRALGIYLEKFGHPIPIIKHPPIDDTTKANLLNALKQIRFETGLLVPKELELELQKAPTGSADTFISVIKGYIDEQIRKTILGQVLTAEAATSSYALGKIHFNILLFYEEELGKDLAEKALNAQIIKRLVDYNFPNVVDYPKFQFNPLVQEDISTIIDKYYQGVSMGIIKPTFEDEERIRDWLKFPKRTRKEQVPVDIQVQDDVMTEMFAEKLFTGVVRRRFTQYEETVDFNEVKSLIEDGVDRYVPRIAELVKEGVDDLIKQIQRFKIIEEKNFEALQKLHFVSTGDIRNEIENALINTFQNSMRLAKQEIMNKKRKFGRYSEVIKFQYEIDIRRLTPEMALEYFRAKSFDMAGIERNYILEKVKTILYNAIKTGATLRDTIEAIQRELAPYYERGLVGDEALRGYRLETVIRTQLNEAFNEGRKSFFEAPELEGYVQAYQYSAILDDRVRPNHACMDGRIYPVTSPIWDTHTPPNGFNCRCILVPVTQDEEWEESPPPPANCVPDAGFEKPGYRRRR